MRLSALLPKRMIDLQLFKNIMAESRNNTDLLDSFSPNQFKSKENLITHINNLGILDDKSENHFSASVSWT